MHAVISCATVESLDWFLSRSQVSVVYVCSLAIESYFPADIADQLTQGCQIDLAITKEDVAKTKLMVNASNYDFIICAGLDPIGKVAETAIGNGTELIIEMLKTYADPSHAADKRRNFLAEVYRHIQTAAEFRKSSKATPHVASPDPFQILGVNSNTPFDGITKEWKRLVALYHPDRVTQLGEKIRNVAESETKRLNEAYQEIKHRVKC